MTNTAEIMDMGMECLMKNLGIVEAEHFISVIIREKSDYTKWHQKYFDNISSDEFQDEAVKYAKEHPFA
jgi:hypothetical protein